MIYSTTLVVSLLVSASAFHPTHVSKTMPRSASGRSLKRSGASALDMVVSKKDSYKVTLLTGDGIGPEIMSATTPVLEAVGKKNGFSFDPGCCE